MSKYPVVQGGHVADDTGEDAPARNRRLVDSLRDAGVSAGLAVEVEYPVLGGRIDVVWLWEGGRSFPVRLPLVGFEVESSWRTRKHIKGDLLNLIDLQPALGVIVLAGTGSEVEATRQVARAMATRHAARIEIWDEARVAALVSGGDAEVEGVLADLPAETLSVPESPARASRKYGPITDWLAVQARDDIDVSFRELEEHLGLPLPPSCRTHVAHWHSYRGSAVARAIHDAGWRAHHVDLRGERLALHRVGVASR
jgi:hypothetical protein